MERRRDMVLSYDAMTVDNMCGCPVGPHGIHGIPRVIIWDFNNSQPTHFNPCSPPPIFIANPVTSKRFPLTKKGKLAPDSQIPR
jgi:hypothetical protein